MKKTYYFHLLIAAVYLSSCNKPDTLFQSLSSSTTGIDFKNKLPDREGFGILYYIYYYNGGGVATGDINNDGLTDIYFTANTPGANKLFLNKGNLQFEDITKTAGVGGTADWCSGVTMADVNADGFLDIYVSSVSGVHGLEGSNQLFINNRNNTFSEQAAAYGLNFSGLSTQAAFFDYDHDGDLDCYLLNHSERPHANIVDTSFRRRYDPLSGDKMFRNDLNLGAKKFTDVSVAAGIYQSSLGYGLGIAVADLNNDGWEDIYIGNDFHENDYYYVNNRNGTFTESGSKVFNHYSRFSMGNDIADFNNDGQPDVITVDMLPSEEKVLKSYGSDENPNIYQFKLMKNGFQHQYSRNCLQRNNGAGKSFSEIGLISGIAATDWSWSPLFADFDNDGNKDLLISAGIVKRPVDLDYIQFVSTLALQSSVQGPEKDKMALEKMPDGSSYPHLFKGDGQLFFKDVSVDWGTSAMKGYFTGAAYADLDNDGDLDVVMNAVNANAILLRNNTSQKRFLSVRFRGDTLNPFGIGAKVYLIHHDKLQYQQLMLTRGFQSSSDPRLHFGIDTIKTIDELVVVWPDQKVQKLEHVAVNKLLVLDHKNASDRSVDPEHDNGFLKIDSNRNVSWKHSENAFVDVNVQYLIPHAESTRGPKIAVADINGDGADDFFVCGAAGQSGALMLQEKEIFKCDSSAFAADAACEDIDAIFFDANGDGYPDLYVASGGNEYSGNDPLLPDRLYMNNGKGKFTKTVDALPALYVNKSCVTAADIDKDGDQDLFIGTLADAKAYGVPQTSFLLLNNGKGKFALANEQVIGLSKIGMVTSATFSDLNGDGWPELIIAGEWMPINIYWNRKGKFEKAILPHSTGLWQTIIADDVNKDGYVDLLAGNWGWNNKFYSAKNGPLKMYVGDFDNNKQIEQLISYTSGGVEYPFLAKDEVERQLPLLKKHYLHHNEYGGVAMKDVFYGWIDTITPLVAERLGSAVFYGDGKESFDIKDLPADLQLSPVFCFSNISGDSSKIYASGGNFFDVNPYEGRYDAQAFGLFQIDNQRRVHIRTNGVTGFIKGQVRDIRKIKMKSGKSIIVVARNNDRLLMLSVNK
ncbi:MAG TPA: VCBS repeat-containing protein [Flavitalea sp.]|nr:VCBS repeat-containing protein [Flavitalea sp.]